MQCEWILWVNCIRMLPKIQFLLQFFSHWKIHRPKDLQSHPRRICFYICFESIIEWITWHVSGGPAQMWWSVIIFFLYIMFFAYFLLHVLWLTMGTLILFKQVFPYGSEWLKMPHPATEHIWFPKNWNWFFRIFSKLKNAYVRVGLENLLNQWSTTLRPSYSKVQTR